MKKLETTPESSYITGMLEFLGEDAKENPNDHPQSGPVMSEDGGVYVPHIGWV